ncbi:hypothetical protein, partial [Kingella negevensis]
QRFRMVVWKQYLKSFASSFELSIAPNILYLAQRYAMWDYSEANIQHFWERGISHVKHLPLGFQAALKRIELSSTPDIDVLFYGSLNERRVNILNQLPKQGLRVEVLQDVFGKERDKWIARSKVVLNMHYFDSQIFEIVRCFYLMTNGVAVVSEVNPNTSIQAAYLNGIVATPYEQLVQTCVNLCMQPETQLAQQKEALQTMQALPQANIMQQLLKAA